MTKKFSPLSEFDAIAILEQEAFDCIHASAPPGTIDEVLGKLRVDPGDLTEPNWEILGEYISKPACDLMRHQEDMTCSRTTRRKSSRTPKG
jgi:hypothetical protein